MRLALKRNVKSGTKGEAFSLVEVLFAVAIVGSLMVSLYLAIASGVGIVQATREDLRATQILQEKMETIRLYTWEQINSNGFIPATFTAPFYATNIVSGNSNVYSSMAGLTYTGSVTIVSLPFTDVAYSNDLKQVNVTLQWISGKRLQSRDISTIVSHYGLQPYIY